MFHYSKYPPGFYKAHLDSDVVISISRACAEAAGLWNIAWLLLPDSFEKYEQSRADPKELPMLTPKTEQFVIALSKARLGPLKLGDVFAEHPAVDAFEILQNSPSIDLLGAISKKQWESAYDLFRLNAPKSADVFCEAEAFWPPKLIAAEAKKDIQSQLQAGPPAPPIFTHRAPGQVINFNEWLDKLKGGTVH